MLAILIRKCLHHNCKEYEKGMQKKGNLTLVEQGFSLNLALHLALPTATEKHIVCNG